MAGEKGRNYSKDFHSIKLCFGYQLRVYHDNLLTEVSKGFFSSFNSVDHGLRGCISVTMANDIQIETHSLHEARQDKSRRGAKHSRIVCVSGVGIDIAPSTILKILIPCINFVRLTFIIISQCSFHYFTNSFHSRTAILIV